MAYSVIALKDLTELKNRRGNSTSTTIATILGLTYPLVEAYAVYVWDDTSLAACDDNEIVCPFIPLTGGRWYKVDLDQVPQANTDWDAISGVTEILNKPTFSTVATSGSYNDLLDQPVIPSAQVSSDWTASTGPTSILNKPSIPSNQVNCDWSSVSGISQILNKPSVISAFTNDAGYLTSITSGQLTTALGYTPLNPSRTLTINGTALDLSTDRSWSVGDILSTGSYANPSWITTLAYSKLTGAPSLATVATSGSYNDLSGKPTIPLAITLTTTGTTGSATLVGSTLNIPLYVGVSDYTSTTTTTSGNAIFYLTSDGTSTGTALYTNITYVQPVVNDATLNYTYGWIISVDKKTLTINTKVSTGINIALLGLTLLGTPANVPNGTIVSVLVKGN